MFLIVELTLRHAESEFNTSEDLLFRVLRVFNDPILDEIPGDTFGRIYEYFLNKFAQNDAQEGGEFFTPPSLVNTIVKIIEPTEVLDEISKII